MVLAGEHQALHKTTQHLSLNVRFLEESASQGQHTPRTLQRPSQVVPRGRTAGLTARSPKGFGKTTAGRALNHGLLQTNPRARPAAAAAPATPARPRPRALWLRPRGRHFVASSGEKAGLRPPGHRVWAATKILQVCVVRTAQGVCRNPPRHRPPRLIRPPESRRPIHTQRPGNDGVEAQ